RSKDRIAVTKCICRVQQGLLDNACDKPLEVCLAFGSHGQYYVDKGMGRWISTEQALAILDECDEAGLVPQPFNAQNPGGLCNCCGDCCGALRALKMQDKPAEKVLSNYFAAVDADECTECGTCEQRCPMDAISAADAAAKVDRDRCIGCGLCVTTCPAEAVTLEVKSPEEQRTPPKSAQETMMQLAAQRGKSLVPLAAMRKG
ncbi:MAG: 4Fe-4S binding protein, partial [Deltaproteobacteria bacterium]|nr:4Fe-4S binding protein [Deltaproteobacteria bacterium]